MNPVLHLVLLVFALCCFAFDAGVSKAAARMMPLGLAFLVASMISW